MTGKWVPVLAYDVAYIDKRSMVLIRGGDWYKLPPGALPGWRLYAAAVDMDAARSIAKALNGALESP